MRTDGNTQTKRKYTDLKSSLDTIHVYAEHYGLSNMALRTLLIEVKRPGPLDQPSQNAIIKSLYPAGKVSSELIYIVVGCLGYGSRKASLSSQQSLLKWISMVANYLEEPSQLSCFYSVLFNLLDMMSIRADLCHLLAQITRRKHVRPFRIYLLRDLSKSAGHEPALLKLMYVYDKYAPGILALGKPRSKFMDDAPSDPDWVSQLERIQRSGGSVSKNDNQLASSRFLSQRVKASDTVKDLHAVEILVNQLENIRISDLTAADLKDPVLQIYARLTTQKASSDQVDDYLTSILDKETEKTPGQRDIAQTTVNVLESVLTYSRYTKVCIPSLIILQSLTCVPGPSQTRDSIL